MGRVQTFQVGDCAKNETVVEVPSDPSSKMPTQDVLQDSNSGGKDAPDLVISANGSGFAMPPAIVQRVLDRVNRDSSSAALKAEAPPHLQPKPSLDRGDDVVGDGQATERPASPAS